MDSDVDLIPAEFRQWRTRTAHLWLTAIAMVASVSFIAVLALWLATKAGALEQANAQQETQAALTTHQRAQLDVLDERYQALKEEWTLLRGLRSGASIEDLFVLVDRALIEGEVWFSDWRLRRAGVMVPASAAPVNTGYFLVMPAGSGGQTADQWQVRTMMVIRGQASDHAALSRFVRGLYQQPDVQEVKLNRTNLHTYQEASAVDFELSIALNSKAAAEG